MCCFLGSALTELDTEPRWAQRRWPPSLRPVCVWSSPLRLLLQALDPFGFFL